jgi:hypothetical protein
MPKVRGNGAQRWANRTAAATEDYKAGVAQPRTPWAQATVAAAETHKQATTKALNEGRFAKGVQKAGDAKWSEKAQTKGAERFGPGAAAGVADYQTAVAPYLAVIESTPLPPRGPKGDPRNIERVRVLAAALNKKKMGSALLPLLAIVSLAFSVAVGTVMVRGAGASRPRTPAERSRNAGPALPRQKALTPTKCAFALAVVVPLFFLGAALDVITGTVTAAAAGGTAMAAAAGDALSARNTALDQKPVMLSCWAKTQTSGFVQITHASGHDLVRDMRFRHVAAANLPLMPEGISEPFEPQELINLTLSAGAVAGDIELLHMLMYYPDLPGVSAKLIDIDGLLNRFRCNVTIEDTTTATGGGAYSGARAWNAASALLKANTDYALLGANIGALCGALTVRGTDSGNLRCAIPGMAGRPDVTSSWFVFLCEQYGLPLIPVFNSANVASIFTENVQDENLTAVPFALNLVELTPG